MGRGSLESNVMLLGEAPGKREDDLGKPFQGRAGQLLDEVFKLLGINRDNVFITNACRCKPTNNRTPTLKEIASCRPYLKAEIRLVKPKIIVAMGNVALRSLSISSGIERGKVYHSAAWRHRVVFTWHPGYVLRRGRSSKSMHDFIDHIRMAIERGVL